MNDEKIIDDVRQIVNNVKTTFQTEHETNRVTFGTMMQKIKAVNTFLALWEEHKLSHPENIYRQFDMLQAQYEKVVEQNRQLQQELMDYRSRTNVTKL